MKSTTNIVKLKYHKSLSELNWLLEKALNTSTLSKHGDKVENWFKAHNDIPASEIPNEIMIMLNTFDARRYGKLKLRFQ